MLFYVVFGIMEPAYILPVSFFGGESMTRKSSAMILALMIFASALFSGCDFDYFDYFEGDDRYFFDSVSGNMLFTEHNDYSYVVTDTSELLKYSVKNTLDETETEIYNRLVYMIDNFELSYDFENITNDQFKKAYYAVLYDHPEYFWLGQNYIYSLRTFGDYSTFHVEPKVFSSDPKEIKQAQREFDKVLGNIVSAAKSQEDIFSQVRYVHDYIIDNTAYDMATIELVDSGEEYDFLRAVTAYGCLVEHKAICSGYSAAFQLVMQRLNLECGRVNGTRVSEKGPHQWNYLGIGGEYYYIDLTWDDPVRSNGEETRTYEYFLISESDLAYTHTLNGDLPVPECTGTRFNYYRYCGLYFEEYDYRYIKAAADLLKDDRCVTLKYSTPEELQKAVDDLITDQHIFDIDYINSKVSYSVSSSGCILTIYY